MASKQLLLVLFCGEIWSCLCAAAAPQHAATAESSTTTSPRADKALLNQLQATGPSSHQSDTATEPQPFPGQEEAGDGSWVAAVMLGSVLIGMVLAMITILLWKCCMRPALAESHWAGRSPFVDGDTPDLLMDSEQGTKRSSVLFMLPWRLKQGTNLQEELTVSENPPQHTTNSENGQAALACSPAPAPAPAPVPVPASSAAASCPAPAPAPVPVPVPASSAAASCPAPAPAPVPVPAPASSAAASCSAPAPAPVPAPVPAPAPASSAAASCPAPDPAPECCDLPPPPEWLREPPEQPSLDPHEHSALHLEAEEPQPPAPELLMQETHETLPQPEHPL